MTRTVVFALYPGCVALDVMGPHEVFALAAAWTGRRGKPAYEVVRAGVKTGPITTASGMVLHAEARLRDVKPHTLIVPGFPSGSSKAPESLVRWLRRSPACARRVSVCTGAFIFAEAGWLDGRTAATHWAASERFAERFPQVRVDREAVYVQSDDVWTSAGVTAGIDLALALVEMDCGSQLAGRIARELVVFLRRPGGQSQFSAYLEAPPAGDDRIRRAQIYISEHLGERLTVEGLAAQAAMSPRHFARTFRAEVGVSPGKHVERCRVEAVRNGLEVGAEDLTELAGRWGFTSAEVMRRAFRRHFGVSPEAYRQRFRVRDIGSSAMTH